MVSFVGFPVIIIAEGNQNATYFISAAVIFTICCSILILMYVPKYIALNQKKPETGPSFSSKTKTSSLTSDDEGIKIMWSPQVQTDLEEKIKVLTKQNEDLMKALQEQPDQTKESGDDNDDHSFDFDDEGGFKMEE